MTIETTHLHIRPISLDDTNAFLQWISDYETIKYSLSLFQKINTYDAVKNYISSLISDQTSRNFTILTKQNSIPIGYSGLANISTMNRSAEYFILIGHQNFWNNGFGTEVGRAIIHYGFIELELHRIMLTVFEPNIGAIKSYEKLGFQREGILRDACYRDTKYHNKILMSILVEEYNQAI